MTPLIRFKKTHLLLGMMAAIVLGSLLVIVRTSAATGAVSAPGPGSPMHPTFPLLDADGQSVVETGNPVSTMQTCGACHDTAFIADHNAHANVIAAGLAAPSGEILISAAEQEWTALDASTGVEVNCFLCHTTAPNNAARLEALATGQVDWANTATLAGSGIVEANDSGYQWNADAFDETGSLKEGVLGIQDPTVENCAQCHAAATSDVITPLTFEACRPDDQRTFTTGEVFAPQRINESGLNISGKDDLIRTWDVHAERVVACTDCHYAANNPAYGGSAESDLAHLEFDPRQQELGEYLNQPEHVFAHSDSDPAARGCTTCHNAAAAHEFLPYSDRHMEAVACETCHTPSLEAPASQAIDWTVVTPEGGPAISCRGESLDPAGGQTLLTGYTPVLMRNEDGKIAPYNLTATWYWAAGADAQPIPFADLRAAYLDGDAYAPDVLQAFDADQNSVLDSTELIINSAEKHTLIAGRLAGLGYADARIVGEVQTYAIHHSVAASDQATRDCGTCHTDNSAVAAPMLIASAAPGGVIPHLTDGNPSNGSIGTGTGGALYFTPQSGTDATGRYIFGFSRVALVDWIGAGVFVATLLAVVTHGGLRFLAVRRHGRHNAELEEAYMYSFYERLWHWLQTATIGILIFTGLVIHRPEMFGMFSFPGVVLIHNVVAAILLINAVLAAFYHFASGEIQQFLPRPHGLFDQLFRQARFYLDGIFRNEPHPFEKTPQRKMNPLQQITYLGLLNVLLPLQVITGILMWGAERWPNLAAMLGGLPLLAPVHTLIAWLFAAFIVAHVYLATTGPAPLTSIKGMIMGWEDVEAQAAATD